MTAARAASLFSLLALGCMDPKPVNEAVREMRGGAASKSFLISPLRREWLSKQPWADPARCAFLGAHEEEYFALFRCDNGDRVRLQFDVGEGEGLSDPNRSVHLIRAYVGHLDGGMTEIPLDLR